MSGQGFSLGILAADYLWLQFGQTPPAQLLPVVYQGNTFRNNQEHLATLYDNGSQIVGNTFGAGIGYRPAGIGVTGRNTLVATNRFYNLPTGVMLIGDDPDFPNGAIGIATNSAVIDNRFCNVANPIVVEPLANNTTQQGTLTCQFAVPALDIASAVLLSWPEDGETHTLESAPGPKGPWSPMKAALAAQDGEVTLAVKTDRQHQFFRLR